MRSSPKNPLSAIYSPFVHGADLNLPLAAHCLRRQARPAEVLSIKLMREKQSCK